MPLGKKTTVLFLAVGFAFLFAPYAYADQADRHADRANRVSKLTPNRCPIVPHCLVSLNRPQ